MDKSARKLKVAVRRKVFQRFLFLEVFVFASSCPPEEDFGALSNKDQQCNK